jgi:hypothetical protein
MKSPIFLSASVPVREPFASNCDVIAIREAVLALVAVTVRERELVFGGHPAISPLVEHAARSLNSIQNVHIYQSRWFQERNIIPEVAYKFENFHWTDIPQASPELNASLTAMREEMIRSRSFSAAFVIGGMEGIYEEAAIFKRLHEGKPLIPLASTGGSSVTIFEQEKDRWNSDVADELLRERRYRRLIKKVLPID